MTASTFSPSPVSPSSSSSTAFSPSSFSPSYTKSLPSSTTEHTLPYHLDRHRKRRLGTTSSSATFSIHSTNTTVPSPSSLSLASLSLSALPSLPSLASLFSVLPNSNTSQQPQLPSSSHNIGTLNTNSNIRARGRTTQNDGQLFSAVSVSTKSSPSFVKSSFEGFFKKMLTRRSTQAATAPSDSNDVEESDCSPSVVDCQSALSYNTLEDLDGSLFDSSSLSYYGPSRHGLPFDILFTPPEEDDEVKSDRDALSLSDDHNRSYPPSPTLSASNESIFSSPGSAESSSSDVSDQVDTLSLHSNYSSGCGRSRSSSRPKPVALEPVVHTNAFHPLRSRTNLTLGESALDLDLASSPVLSSPVLPNEETGTTTALTIQEERQAWLNLNPMTSAFRSNLTASLRVLRNAAKTLTFTLPTDHVVTQSILSLEPHIPYTDERRPILLDEPSADLRRYLNPTTLSSRHINSYPNSPSSVPERRIFTASIQMQTYRVYGSRRRPAFMRSLSYPNVNTSSENMRLSSQRGRTTTRNADSNTTSSNSEQDSVDESCSSHPTRRQKRTTSPYQPPQQTPNQTSFAYPPGSLRQREIRENPDFIRIAVMEMAMRRNGKLNDDWPGRARWTLPPRQTEQEHYLVLPNGVPARWVSQSS